MNSRHMVTIFEGAITDYHRIDDVDQTFHGSEEGSSEWSETLYHKCWIDTVQWHLEDIIRDPHIDPMQALAIKRRIDESNQNRTDKVEQLDSLIVNYLSPPEPNVDARINTESPGWAIDRLSILCLKIYHMNEEANRLDADASHRKKCSDKLDVLMFQMKYLSTAIDQLFEDVSCGRRIIKTYQQMKMYNDDSLNPVLYGLKKES